jgi:DNA polymerase-3 subunit alpha
MSPAPFVHLRLHTEFSVVDGTTRIDDVAAAAAADGQPALAITDLGNAFGAVKHHGACRARGVQPLLGADLWLEPPEGLPAAGAAAGSAADPRTTARLLVLVQSDTGWRNLCLLLSRAWQENVVRNQAWVKWAWLEAHGEGLLALSGADSGAVGQALLAGDASRADALARRLAAIFPGRFHVEVWRAGQPTNEPHLRAAVALAARLALPVVATHPIQFLAEDDFEAHEARVCIAEGETLANPKRVRRFTPQHHFMTAAQMHERFADLPVALANTVALARRCHQRLALGTARLPDFPTPVLEDGTREPIEAYFRRACAEGLERRLFARFPDPAARAARRAEYTARLEFEIGTIVGMGFAGYFLIVSDFIVWAKAHGCPVGPGRGSGAGSLVAWALEITGLDPIAYGLLFERFLNPDRVSMPDFDIDFCQANRDRVIDYVKQRYGREAVSQIATFGTLAAKAALRDVGRVLGMGYGHVDSIAKLVPAPPGRTVTLAKLPERPDPGLVYARKEEPEIDRREAADEEVAELLALATRVEGVVRNIGMHAGGVLIAPGRITDFSPLYQPPGSTSAVSMFDKDDVEAAGLVKFDFLGLATLTILELAKDFVRARRPGRQDFDYDTLPLDDPKTYRLFAEGRTEAVFQFESRGMQGMLREARPSRIEDLFALNAMYRPGPMDNIPSFCARKHGREEVAYPHPLLEAVLGETYGVMVYQEQVMMAARLLAGYSLGGADVLRRAMGKKKPEEMAKERARFREGAAEAHGIPQAKADEVFDLMEKFAGYGFNKSHAAAYSLLAYHTAWLKAHCPAEFYAANMTVEQDDTDKLRTLRADGRRERVHFEAPCINRGTARFEPLADDRVRWSLAAVKGTGEGAIEAIVAAREGTGPHEGRGGGPFRSLFDFCARVDRQRVNKRVVEALVKAGAFDELHADRAALLASVSLAFDWADAQAASEHQAGLFDFGEDTHGAASQEPSLVAVEPWTVAERLAQEKAALGFHFSGHLFDAAAAEVRRFARRPVAELEDSGREAQVVAGIVGEFRVASTQRGRIGIFRLDDGSDSIEAVVGKELLEAARERLHDDALVIASARVQSDRFGGGLRLNIQQLWDLPAARARFGKHLAVKVNGRDVPVRELVRRWPAKRIESEHGELVQGLAVRLAIEREAVATVDLGEAARMWPSDEALAAWRAAADAGAAAVVYE